MKPRHWALLALLTCWLLLGCQMLFGGVTVHKATAPDSATCNVGDSRCNGEYLLSCDAVTKDWAVNRTCDSADLCDSKNSRCSTCNDGDFRCAGAERQQCAADGSAWKTVETCAAENRCSESSCGGCVTDGQLDCSLGSQLRKCQGGVWATLDDCGTHALCAATTEYATTTSDWDQKCVAPGCPKAGQFQCDSARLQRCPPEQDNWLNVDTCDSAALCEAAAQRVNADPNNVTMVDMCKPACPTPSAFLCDGATLKQCRDDQTAYDTLKVCPGDTECDPAAGDCGKLCQPGQHQCNGATLRVCASNGHWMDQAQCETAALCSVDAATGEAACKPSPCGKNDNTCNGAVLQKCKDDRTGYEDVMTCASAPLCDSVSARCIDPKCPTANAYQCFGQDLKQCAPDFTEWKAVTTCPTGQYCNSGQNPGCLTACPTNPLRCNGKILEHCAAATGWTTQATCSTNDLCNCAITHPDGPSTNSCLGGLYKDGCGNVVCGGVLAAYQCKDAELQKCQPGRNGWDKALTCGAANLCYPGTAPSYSDGACLTCPTAGELACNGSTLRMCSADRKSWTNSQTCSLGCIAVQNGQDYCAACKTGTSQCAGQTLQTCPADQKAWQNKTCANVCDATNAQCDQCAANSYWCSGSTLNKCSADGQSQTSSTCLSSALCNAGAKKCDACANGQHLCKGTNSQICNTDKSGFMTGTECGTPGCNTATNNCNACTTNQHKCKGTNSQVCNTDKTGFIDGPDCGTLGCNTTTNSCNACVANQHQCKGTNSQVCSLDRSMFVDGPECGTLGCNTTTNNCNVCTAGQHKCKGSNSQVCSADRTMFVDGPDCMTAGCNATTNECNKAICTPSDFQCAGTGGLALQKCNLTGTAWATVQTCGTICDATQGECDDCVAPAFNCASNVLQDCTANGHWETKQDCMTLVCNPAGTCDAAMPPSP